MREPMKTKRIPIGKGLYLDEYIPRSLYETYAAEHREHILIGLIDRRLVEADEMLRAKFGPVVINDWGGGGESEWRGLRVLGCKLYSRTSQHSYGRASDKTFKNADAEEVRKYIREHWKELGITCIEKGVSWVHSDVRWHTGTGLLEVAGS